MIVEPYLDVNHPADESLLALFLVESFTEESVFHFDVFFQRLLALAEVTQVSVGELPLLLPKVPVAQTYACGKI